MRFLAKG